MLNRIAIVTWGCKHVIPHFLRLIPMRNEIQLKQLGHEDISEVPVNPKMHTKKSTNGA